MKLPTFIFGPSRPCRARRPWAAYTAYITTVCASMAAAAAVATGMAGGL